MSTCAERPGSGPRPWAEPPPVYLRSGGLSEQELERLRERLREEADGAGGAGAVS